MVSDKATDAPRSRRGFTTWPADPFRFAALLTFVTAFLFDALVTWWGQGDLYWSGYYLATREGNPAAEAVFRSGPLLGFAFGFFAIALGWALATWLPRWAVAGFACWYVVRHTMAGAGWLSSNRGVGLAIATVFVLGLASLAAWAGLLFVRRERTSRMSLLVGPALSLSLQVALVGTCWSSFDLSRSQSRTNAAERYRMAARYDVARELYKGELAERHHLPAVRFAVCLRLASLEAVVGRRYEAERNLDLALESIEEMSGDTRRIEAFYWENASEVALDCGDIPRARERLRRAVSLFDAELAEQQLYDDKYFIGRRDACVNRLLRLVGSDARLVTGITAS